MSASSQPLGESRARLWSSPWDGGDRRLLRGGLTMVALFDAVYLLRGVLTSDAAVEVSRNPSNVFEHAAGSRPLLGCLVLIVVWSLLRFARGWKPLLTGTAGLIALAFLAETYAALHGGPYRANFFSGAMLLGWLVGSAWAQGAKLAPRDALRFAEAGAVGMLSAAYVGAALSKLGGAGLAWADPNTLRAILLAHAPGDGGFVDIVAGAIVARPWLAQALAASTLLLQLGACGYAWSRRSRLFVGLGLVAFHVGVAATTRIGYWQPVVLLLLFSLPWPRLNSLLRRSPGSALPTLRDAGSAWVALALSAVAVIVLAYGPTLHKRRPSAAHPEAQREVLVP